ncbi:MAG: hypothetical protein CME62_05690 [Halobacteriovoraceae bacterium]|nr:hypothetical protein [Halobacteriovoraceae bacterium]
MNRFIISIFLFSTLCFAGAKKFVIYTDEPDQTRAQELVQYLQNNPPLSYYNIEYTIEAATSQTLGCSSSDGIARLIVCETERINRMAVRGGHDQAMVVANIDRHGGSGGSVPVMTKAAPNSTMVHEYLHTLGFCDEYEYDQYEAGVYCTRDYFENAHNLALIEPLSGGYNNDSHARSEHNNEIPWYSVIANTTPISTGRSLGTPGNSAGAEVIGLFQAVTCNDKAQMRGKVWKPTSGASIMENLSVSSESLNPLITSVLEAQGFERREGVELPEVTVINEVDFDEPETSNIQTQNTCDPEQGRRSLPFTGTSSENLEKIARHLSQTTNPHFNKNGTFKPTYFDKKYDKFFLPAEINSRQRPIRTPMAPQPRMIQQNIDWGYSQ